MRAQRHTPLVEPEPGSFEYGTLSFKRAPYYGSVDVEIEEDGTVAVCWTERADDYCGTYERRMRFSAAEFDQIITVRSEQRKATT